MARNSRTPAYPLPAYIWVIVCLGTGTPPYAYSVSGLPAGISIASSTGIISGSPSAAGSVGTATITVKDGTSASKSITIAYGVPYEPVAAIIINPGHGGDDTGATVEIMGTLIQEKDITLRVALMLKEKLSVLLPNVLPILTREDDITLSLAARSSFANAVTFGTAVLLSIPAGVLAKTIQAELLKEIPLLDRYAKEADFPILRETNMPAALANGLVISMNSLYGIKID